MEQLQGSAIPLTIGAGPAGRENRVGGGGGGLREIRPSYVNAGACGGACGGGNGGSGGGEDDDELRLRIR